MALAAIMVNVMTMTLVTVAWIWHHIYFWSGPITLISGAMTIWLNCKMIAKAVAWGNYHRIRHLAQERDQLIKDQLIKAHK